MAKVRNLQRAAQKLEQTAASRAQDYADGVAQDTSWQKNTEAAESAYESGVQQAIAKKRFRKSVSRAGQTKYQKAVQEKGVSRFAEGVSQAGEAWQQGFAPYAEALAAQTLPPRGAKGSAQNLQRMTANVNTIIQTADKIKNAR